MGLQGGGKTTCNSLTAGGISFLFPPVGASLQGAQATMF